MRIFQLIGFICFCSAIGAQIPLQFSGLKRTKLDYLAARIENVKSNKQGQKQQLRLRAADMGSLRTNEVAEEIDNFAAQPWLAGIGRQLEVLRQELINLPAIREASWTWEVNAIGDSTVTWTIEESRTVFPLVNFGGIKGNFHFLLGFNDIHFRGRGQELFGFYQNIDGEHNYQLSLRNQAFNGSRWGYLLESRRYAAIEPVFFSEGAVDYRYANLGFSAGLLFSPRPRQTIHLTLNAFREDYEKTEPRQWPGLGPDELQLHKIALKTGYRVNRIDFLKEKRSGWWLDNTAQIVDNVGGGSQFLIWLGDLRAYRLVNKNGNLAARIRAGLSTNDKTPFAPFVLDSQVNIRGSGNRIDRGTAQLVLNLEYRHTIWADRKDRFSAQIVGFSDFGTWRKPGGSLRELTSSDNFRHFAGGGIRLISHAAQDAVLRIDYGVDLYNNNERGVVLGFGQYF